ncbi:aminotransferase class I/II-fold pyridoxal phosphate-dependent enzyme [Pelagovum pacificum]|uniref:Aminotransferase class I/II-fold pyridoxal phosphate-dependent enzyme n=1 Tax=Pelagovum pacificum TaxID=2588711 RepID=A0A5C5GIQ6_9RHOB|nr:aminotransferase class I/II-fold pyridoxal phosphate-dependent enzyme [Pelagovum pacificum]QQA43096.1 aminotransferase class I/II-fold pyridoxal phosphate-dependent enzyme [Pelagovum pacificum]TNY33761.1 aminotransferase class I/II-fold pyridoxal phosphate-dependent enzyme [Pelagovum pacificum]
MQFPERFSDLPPYAFPRLRSLLDHHEPGGEPLAMTIGEPRHPMPGFVAEVLAGAVEQFAKYPPNEGTPELLDAISGWLGRRYGVDVAPDRLTVLNGTREGLYNAAMALCPETKNGARPVVLMPNPFYQVYAVAALSVGAEPVYLPAREETGFLPDLDAIPAELLDRTAIFYLCSPSNPQGAVADEAYWTRLLNLAEAHDFKVFADECYSEIYRDVPPPGILAVAQAIGADPERVVAFHSLSKRSNLPGLRSGFAAGGPESIRRLRQLRNYAGAPLPLPLQRVAEAAWSDEDHVVENRRLYAEKYHASDAILSDIGRYHAAKAGFFQWLPVEDGESAALTLWKETGVRVLPGAYLGRDDGTGNPGTGYIRVAMVAPLDETQRGLELIRNCLYD